MNTYPGSRQARGFLVNLAWVAGVLCLAGCSQGGYTRVSEDIYVADSVPELKHAAREISSARETAQASQTEGRARSKLSVSVAAGTGIGSESYRVRIEESQILVEGGDVAGALYGAQDVARTIREGREITGGPVVGPSVALRAIRADVEIPGISATPSEIDWQDALDGLAAARMNTLIVPCGKSPTELVRLGRYPRAFGPEQKGRAARVKAFRSFLALARQRNVGVILRFGELGVAESFLQHYARWREDLAPDSALCRSYRKECISALLRTYPDLAGIGVDSSFFKGVADGSSANFTRSVLGGGFEGSGRSALLLVDPDAGDRLHGVALPDEAQVVFLTPWTLQPSRRHAPNGRRTIAAIPWKVLTPPPASLGAVRGVLSLVKERTPDGFCLAIPDLFRSSEYARKRGAFLAITYGLAAFEPSADPATWILLGRQTFGDEFTTVVPAVQSLADMWQELGRFHRWSAGSNPLTCSEAPGSAEGAAGLRDDSPFLSLIEFTFSGSDDPKYLTIPEFVAGDVRGAPVADGRRTPLQVADLMGKQSAEALAVLKPARGKVGGVALELAAAAHVGAYHEQRIRAGIALMRFVAGVDPGARETALEEIRRAKDSWSRAARILSGLTRQAGATGTYPDLAALTEQVGKDRDLIEGVRADPSGFRQSPLVKKWPSGGAFDFRRLRGFLHLGDSIFNRGPVDVVGVGQVLEAEDFADNWQVCTEVPGYSGRGYLSSGVEGRIAALPVTVRVMAAKGGPRHIWVRTLSGGNRGSRSIRLRLGGVQLDATPAREGEPLGFTWEKAGEAILSLGVNFLQVLDAGVGREGLDAIVVTPEGDWVPPHF